MDKKSRIKAGLYFGIWMAVFFILKNLLTEDSPTAKNITIIIVSGLLGGVIAGVLFGWIIGKFASSKSVTRATKINLQANEMILFETSANHFKGAEAVGGKLYLTNQRVVFKSHKFNFQNHELSILLPDIIKVDRYKTLGLVNNGVSIATTGNAIEKFVVQQPEEWVSRLNENSVLHKV